MTRLKTVAILMNLSRPYDRQVIRGITKFIQSSVSWHLYAEENLADKVLKLDTWSEDGVIVDIEDTRNTEAISRFDCEVVGIGEVSPRMLRKSTAQPNDDRGDTPPNAYDNFPNRPRHPTVNRPGSGSGSGNCKRL